MKTPIHPPAKTPTKRRAIIVWTARLLLGVALGFGVRMFYERKPGVRFATGLTLRTLAGEAAANAAPRRGSHLQFGQPVRFSLDEITEAEDPAAALRAWREAYQLAPREVRERCLAVPVEASAKALRRFIGQLASSEALREEIGRLYTVIGENGVFEHDEETVRRVFIELARLDPGLAIDGAEAQESDELKRLVWSVIAEDDPRRVVELVASGQLSQDIAAEAIASLAARSPEEAAALVRSLPEEKMRRALDHVASALAALDPVKALAYGDDGTGRLEPEWASLIAKRVPITKACDLLLALEKDHPDLLAAGDSELGYLLARVARTDPATALRVLDLQKDRNGQIDGPAAKMLVDLADRDRAATLAMVERWPDGYARQSAVAAIAVAWMRQEPIAAVQWMLGEKGNEWSLRMMENNVLNHAPGSIFDDLTSDQARQVAQLIGQSPGAGGSSFFKDSWYADTLAEKWAQSDPSAAYAWASGLTEPKAKRKAANSVLTRWISQDPAGALPALRQELAANPEIIADVLRRSRAMGSETLAPVRALLWERLPELTGSANANGTSQSHPDSNTVAAIAVASPESAAALSAIERVSDAAWRQKTLDAVAQQLERNLPEARRLAGALSHPAEAQRFMEAAIRAQFRR